MRTRLFSRIKASAGIQRSSKQEQKERTRGTEEQSKVYQLWVFVPQEEKLMLTGFRSILRCRELGRNMNLSIKVPDGELCKSQEKELSVEK